MRKGRRTFDVDWGLVASCIMLVCSLLAFLALVVGCGCEPVARIPRLLHAKTSPELAPYVAAFEHAWSDSDGGPRYVNVPVIFVTELQAEREGWDDDVLAQCQMGILDVVEVRRSSWDDHPDVLYRQITIWHELGHCSLRRGHRVALGADSCPLSIMNPYIDPTVDCIDARGSRSDLYQAALVHELFEPYHRGWFPNDEND